MVEKIKYYLFLLKIFRGEGIKSLLYLFIRVLIFPFSVFRYIDGYITLNNNVMDIGCGYGIFSLYLVFQGYRGKIFGLDIDGNRIDKLNKLIENHALKNIIFIKKDIIKEGFDGLDGYETVYMFDILHHLDKITQEKLLNSLSENCKVIIIKDIDTKPRYKYLWNLFHDRYLMGNNILCFLGSGYIQTYLKGLGYNVEYRKINSIFPYPHYLLIATK